MNARFRSMGAGFLLAVAVELFVRPCVAWDPTTECPTLPDDALRAQIEAGRLFDEAEKYYRAGRAADALKSFLCSFQIVQHENTVFNIAQIAKLSQHRDVYLGLLRDFVSKTNGRVKVDPIQEILAELDPSVTGGSEVETAPGKDEVVPPIPETSEAAAVSTTAPKTEKQRHLRIAGWTLFASGAAAAVAGGALQGMAGAAQQSATETDTLAAFNRESSKMRGFQVGAVASFAAGGVLMGTGIVLVVLGKRGKEFPTVSLGPGPGGIHIAGSF